MSGRDPGEYRIGAVEWERGSRSADEVPVRVVPPRVVSLRKPWSGPAEREQWRYARFLLTGEWPA